MRNYELEIGKERRYATVKKSLTVQLCLATRCGDFGKTSISQGFELSRRVIIGPKER